jgi:hypothetical protein
MVLSRSTLAAVTCCAALLCPSERANAQDPKQPKIKTPKTPPREVTGVEEPARHADDGWRSLGNGLLFLPRNAIDYLFRATELAASLVADNQIVPRYREIFGRPGMDFFVFPTLFAETGSASSIGLRMIFDSPRIAASQRLGYGGPEQVEVETRIVLKGRAKKVPYLISVEAYYKLQDKLEYHGIGIFPRLDDRNHFQPTTVHDFGYYVERRVRTTGSLGLRIARDLEIFLSTSIYRRQIRAMDSKEDQAIDRVFDPNSIAGLSPKNPFTSYSEGAVRFDTRRIRTRPSPGFLFEGYLGGAHSLSGIPVAFMRIGTRVAGFIPIYRRTNLLSPRLVVDRVIPVGGAPLPFTELSRQPDYRGYDTRRDFISIVGSVDYTWQLVPALGMRLFVDAATVAPSVTQVSLEQFKHMRVAAGVGLDLFAGKSTLASLAFSGSTDGVRVVASIGVPSSYGDRQHRD